VEGLTVKRIVGVLGWLGVALVVVAVALKFVSSFPDEWRLWSPTFALAGLIVTALYALSQWRDIARSFQGRNVRYGSVALGSVVMILAILGAVNWIGARQNKRWDLSAAGQFSMSDQTKQLLQSLQKPVTFRVFHAAAEGSTTYRDRIDEYRYWSSQVNAEYYEADRKPAESEKYGITVVPTILVEYDGRTERTNSPDEQGLTNALKKAVEGKAKKVYFVQGHGEHDPTSTDPGGFKGAADFLAQDNFEVAKFTLAQDGKVPDDATMVVVAGPTIDFFPPEIEALKAFLAKGGKLLMMFDPPGKGATQHPTSLFALAKEWGIDVGNDLIVDVSGMGRLIGTGAEVPIGMPVPHPITTDFGGLITAYPLARSVTPIEGGTDGRVAQKVVETSPQSWAETDIKALYETGKPVRDTGKGDKAGPVSLAVAVSAAATSATPPPAPAPDAPAPPAPPADAPKPETRIVVIGDSDFASNRAIGIGGNKDLFLNMGNWLALQENLIAIRPKDPEDRRIQLTQDQAQVLNWLTLVIIPGLLFGNAVRVWWKRR
jgi:ABC-type uncharacterized transport system involved in gliding motility auxiliary subunit